MCILFLNSDPVHDLKLIMAFNRDEVKARPTLPAHYWDAQQIWCGKDASPGGVPDGTWLGVSRSGRMGALLNVHHRLAGIVFSADKASRGGLVPGYLTSRDSAEQYVGSIRGGQYNYFNLVMGEFGGSNPSLHIYDFYGDNLIDLPQGVHCYGNLPPTFTNNRADYGHKIFTELLQNFRQQEFTDTTSRDQYLADKLFLMLSDTREIPVNEGLTGSFRHIYNAGYIVDPTRNIESGSVSSSVFFVDGDNNCFLAERTNFRSEKGEKIIVKFGWKIES